jgi:hypothetical protein
MVFFQKIVKFCSSSPKLKCALVQLKIVNMNDKLIYLFIQIVCMLYFEHALLKSIIKHIYCDLIKRCGRQKEIVLPKNSLISTLKKNKNLKNK